MRKKHKISDIIKKKSSRGITDYGKIHEICTHWWNWEFLEMCRKIRKYEWQHRTWFARELLHYIDTLDLKKDMYKEFIYKDITEMYAEYYYNRTMYKMY